MPTTTDLVSEIVDRLDRHRGSARVRVFDAEDVRRIVETHRAAETWAAANGLDPATVETRAVGGTVPNSYKYAPAADEFRIRDGRVVSAGRGRANKAPHGDGPRAVVAVRVEAGTAASDAAKANPPEGARLHGGYLRWYVD